MDASKIEDKLFSLIERHINTGSKSIEIKLPKEEINSLNDYWDKKETRLIYGKESEPTEGFTVYYGGVKVILVEE